MAPSEESRQSDIMALDRCGAFITPVTRRESSKQGPLAGIRYAVKDLFDVAGLPTTAGNPEYADWRGIPRQDAEVIRRLDRAGAVLVGKTHTHELAYGITGINGHFGTPRNPHDPERIPGGSSSGSAAAVGAGLVPFALGTDTGGSIRVPAAFCGIFGFRPTHGLVSAEGVVPLGPTFDTPGVLAQTGDLLERVSRVLFDPPSPGPWAAEPEQLLLVTDALEMCDPEAVAGAEEVRRALEQHGLRVGEIRLGYLNEAREVQQVLQGAQAWAVHREWLETRQPTLGADVRLLLERASKLTSAEIGAAMASQSRLKAAVERDLPAGSVWLIPCANGPAPRFQDLEDDEKRLSFRQRTLNLTNVVSLTGLPAVAVPVVRPGQLPVGVQLVGTWRSDLRLLHLARVCDSALASAKGGA